MAPPPTTTDVIDWDEAMQQCGDDEEFLRELLADLRSEAETQLVNIEATIANPTDDPYQRIMRAAHVIKGASANLMCAQLRATSLVLERAASQCHEQGGTASPPPLQAAVQTAYADLKQAAHNYVAYLVSIGV